MIFLISFDRDFNIYHSCGDDVRRPTLHLCGEYQTPKIAGAFMLARQHEIDLICYTNYSALDNRWFLAEREESPGSIEQDSC